MEKVKLESPPSDSKTASLASQSLPFPSSPNTEKRTQQFASNFTALFHSIFPPKPSPLPSSLSISLTPSTSSPSSSTSPMDHTPTEHRLQQARLMLDLEQLFDHFEVSLSRLQNLTRELESLRLENEDLRLANNELVELLNLSSNAGIPSQNKNRELVADFIPHRVIEPNQVERKNVERVALPKGVSVRSSGYLKLNRSGASTDAVTSNATRLRMASQLDRLVSAGSAGQRVYAAGGGGKVEATEMELEVYRQGMWKTELCNKWQESGTCPYSRHCQFAHGMAQLRPVIRHPRYKTQACRMVVAGDMCPYGHRCHFRHSLTEQEMRLLGPR